MVAEYQRLFPLSFWLIGERIIKPLRSDSGLSYYQPDVLRGKFKDPLETNLPALFPCLGLLLAPALDVEGACLVQDFQLPLVYSRLSYTYQSHVPCYCRGLVSSERRGGLSLTYGAWLGPRACHYPRRPSR